MATVRIFIPLHNAQDYILETLKSVSSQTFTDWDCVISDDESTDNSVEIVKRYIEGDPRFKLNLFKRANSVAASWNRCLKDNNSIATKLICSDDYMYDICLEHQLRILKINKTSAVFSRRAIKLPSGRTFVPSIPKYGHEIESFEAFSIYLKSGRNIFGEPVSALFKTSDLLESKGFSESRKFTLDLSGYAEITKNKTLSLDDKVVGVFRVSKNQWSYRVRKSQNKDYFIFNRYLLSNHFANVSKFELFMGELKGRLYTILRSLIYRFM